jgi:hypothetical protein
MDKLQQQLAETMRRINTKNLNEQATPADLSELYPLYAIMRYLEGHVYRLSELFEKFDAKYPASTRAMGALPPAEQLKIALGILQKVKDVSKIYEDQTKNFYNDHT